MKKDTSKPDKPGKQISATIDTEMAALLDLMLAKTNLSLQDVVEASARNFIARNASVLTPAERSQFKNLF
jgi:hypothetical protein